MLLACHGRVRDFCRQLDALPAYLNQRGLDTAAHNSIAAIIRYFDIAGPAHHQDEEDELFPIMLEVLPYSVTRLEQLHQEHLHLQQTWLQIRQNLLSLTEGHPVLPSEPDIQAFTAQYHAHAELEENWLFPTVAGLLSAEQLRAAGERMAQRRRIVPETEIQ